VARAVATLPPDGHVVIDPIADFKKRTRYSPRSGALHPEAVDQLEPNRRYESFRPIEDTAGRDGIGAINYLFDADFYYYAGDGVVTSTLTVRRRGEVVPVTIKSARAVAEGGSGDMGEPVALDFEKNDDHHTSALELAETFAEHHGPIRLMVEFEYEPGKRQEAALRIFTTPANAIPARFLGEYRDGPANGSLVVEAAVQVFEPGFYRFDANLFSSDGIPLAFADFKGELIAGKQWVDLEFFGLLLRDLGVPGPYELRNLRGYLFLDSEYPDRLRMRDATSSYWTHPYDLNSFSDEEHMTPHKAHMLDLLQQDQQAGLSVDTPGAPPASEMPTGEVAPSASTSP
jgi:hypothetical protein